MKGTALFSIVVLVLLSTFSFLSVGAAEDTIPPIITHVPVTDATEGQEIAIYANVTDDVAVAWVTLHYIEVGGCWCKTKTITMKNQEGTGIYGATIPARDVTTKGIKYYLRTSDGYNETTDPATNPTLYAHRIAVTSTNLPATAVTLYNPTNITESSMQLVWTTNNDTGFDRYEIYQSTSNETLGALIFTIEDESITSYNVTPLWANTTYFFTVRVQHTGGLFADSNKVFGETMRSSTTQSGTAFPWNWLVGLSIVIVASVTLLTTIKLGLGRKKNASKEPDIEPTTQKLITQILTLLVFIHSKRARFY